METDRTWKQQDIADSGKVWTQIGTSVANATNGLHGTQTGFRKENNTKDSSERRLGELLSNECGRVRDLHRRFLDQ